MKASEEQKENRSELLRGRWGGKEGRRRYFGRDEVCGWGFRSAMAQLERKRLDTRGFGGSAVRSPHTAVPPGSAGPRARVGAVEPRPCGRPGARPFAGGQRGWPDGNPCSRAHPGLPRATHGLLGAGSPRRPPCRVLPERYRRVRHPPLTTAPCPPRTLICGKLKAGPCQQRGCR